MNADISNGSGPHLKPWPRGSQYDARLLENGDRRNVLDKYRYWSVEAIKRDLDSTRQNVEIVIENVARDFNMGTIVRNANAFNVAKVHIIGSRQWNKRGAMLTDTYMRIVYHADLATFIEVMKQQKKSVVAVDIVPGAQPIHEAELPYDSVLVFGAEGPGLSAAMLDQADMTVMIEQSGSTRSVNVGVASGIAMYVWTQQHKLTH